MLKKENKNKLIDLLSWNAFGPAERIADGNIRLANYINANDYWVREAMALL